MTAAAQPAAAQPAARLTAPTRQAPTDLTLSFVDEATVRKIATAAAGAVLGVHPFNQPDVELAKEGQEIRIKRLGLGAKTIYDVVLVDAMYDGETAPF